MQRGFSLLELVVTLAVASMLVSLAVPVGERLVDDARANSAINDLARTIALARSAALTYQRRVKLCPGTGNACGARNAWADGMLVFTDDDGDQRLDTDELVIARIRGTTHGRFTWRSFRNRSELLFTAYGLTDWLNGSFLYCPDDNDSRQARMLILNTAGRTRHAQDRNRDGIREDASGRPLSCSA